MKILRRIAAILVITISVVFFILFAGGILGAWSVRVSITEGLLALVAPVEFTAETAGRVLDETDAKFAEAQAEIASVETSLRELQTSAERQEQVRQEVRQVVSQTIGARLAPLVTEAVAGLQTVSAALSVADETMTAISEIPLVRNPLPGTEQVHQLNTRVDAFSTRVNDLREADRQLDLQASETLRAVDELLVSLDQGAIELRTSLADYRARVTAFEAQVQAVEQAIPPTVFWSIFGLTFVLGWLAASQIGLIMHAWAWYRKP